MDIATIRQQFPQYNDMSDADLAGALHDKFYSDMPFDEFSQKIGLQTGGVKEAPSGPQLLNPNNPNGARVMPAPGDPNRMLAVQPQSNGPFDWSKVPGDLAGLALSLKNGLTYNLANPLDAALGFSADKAPFSGNYQERLGSLNARDAAVPPVLRKTGETLGVLASPVSKVIGGVADTYLPMINAAGKAAPVLQRYSNLALQGGLLNTLYQAAFGDKKTAEKSAAGTGLVGAAGMVAPEGGGIGPRALEAGKDFLKGAALATGPVALVEGGGKVLDTVLSPILARLNPEEEGLARVASTMAEDDITPQMAESKLAKRGEQGMVADLSPGLQKLGGDTVQFPGEGRTFAQRQLMAREGSKLATTGGSIGRIEDALGATLSDQGAVDAASGLIKQRTQESSPVWKDLFSEPVVPESKTLDVLAKNSVVKRAMQSGQSTATNFANSLGEELPATAFGADGKPTLQGWHAVTSTLGKTISDVRQGLIETPPDASLASLEAIHASIMKELTNSAVNPLAEKFGQALDTWSGPTAALDALRLGAKVARGDARLTTQLVGDMTDSEREFFRIGLADQAQFLASNSSSGTTALNKIFGTQNLRRNLEAAFDTRDEFNQFRQAVAREQNFAATKNLALGGSPTATREAGMAELGKEVGKATVEGAKEGGATGGFIQGGKALAKGAWMSLSQPEAMRAQISRYLYTRDPAERQALLDKIAELNAKGSIFAKPGIGYVPRTTVLASKAPFIFGGP